HRRDEESRLSSEDAHGQDFGGGVLVMSTSTLMTASWMASRTAVTTASVSTPEPISSASLVMAADCAASCASVRRVMISMFRADVISAMCVLVLAVDGLGLAMTPSIVSTVLAIFLASASVMATGFSSIGVVFGGVAPFGRGAPAFTQA